MLIYSTAALSIQIPVIMICNINNCFLIRYNFIINPQFIIYL